MNIVNAFSIGCLTVVGGNRDNLCRRVDKTLCLALVDKEESFVIGGKMPLTPDHRTFGTFSIAYDVTEGGFDTLSFSIVRKFHCWQLIAMLEFDREYENKKYTWDVAYSFQANLTGLTSQMNDVQNSFLRSLNENGGKFEF